LIISFGTFKSTKKRTGRASPPIRIRQLLSKLKNENTYQRDAVPVPVFSGLPVLSLPKGAITITEKVHGGKTKSPHGIGRNNNNTY
jgi:hypothetical protein